MSDGNCFSTPAGFRGMYSFEHVRNGEIIDTWSQPNLIPTEGLNYILDLLFQAGTSKQLGWYMGLGTGGHTPAATDTAANLPTLVVETSAYTGTRPSVVMLSASGGAATNSASKATFTFTSAVTLTNAFVVSTATGTTGVALSSLAISPSKVMASGDQLIVTFSFSATSV